MKLFDKLKQISDVVKTHMDAISQLTTGSKSKESDSLLKKLNIKSGIKSLIDFAFGVGKSESKNSGDSSRSKDSSKSKINTDDSSRKDSSDSSLSLLDKLKMKAQQAMDSLSQRVHSSIMTSIIQSELHSTDRSSHNASKFNLKHELKQHIDSIKQDWTRIARTEMWDSKLHSEADTLIRSKPHAKSDEVYVMKKTQPNACAICKRLYLESDLMTPRIFKLSDLMKNGTNYGKKAEDWLPVLGCVHPNCQCQLVVVDKDGNEK